MQLTQHVRQARQIGAIGVRHDVEIHRRPWVAVRGNRDTADDDVHDIVFVQEPQQWLRVQCLSCHAGVQLLPPLRPGWQSAPVRRPP